MTEDKKQRLAKLKERYDELKTHGPGHCSGTKSFVPHSIPPKLYAELEELEEEIKKLL